MKLIDEFSNFQPIIESYLTDDNYSIPLSTKDKLSYMRLLPFNKSGFTYYELDRIRDRGIIFSLVTVKGLKTIRKDSSHIIEEDLSHLEWITLLGELADSHMNSEEYLAFLRGYTKSKGGCLGVFLLFSILLTLIF